MNPEKASTVERRIGRVLLAAARILLAILLAKGALAFLLHGRNAFAHLGRPDGARIAISLVELLGAGLFLWRRTALAGGVVLSLLLAWVAGFHFAAGWGSRMLLLFLAAVVALTALSVRRQAPLDSGNAA